MSTVVAALPTISPRAACQPPGRAGIRVADAVREVEPRDPPGASSMIGWRWGVISYSPTHACSTNAASSGGKTRTAVGGARR